MSGNFYSGYADDRSPRGEKGRAVASRTYGAGTTQPIVQTFQGSHGNSRSTTMVTDRDRRGHYGYDAVQEQPGGAHYREAHGRYSTSGASYAPQRMEQRHRSLQASKQMLYDVYAQNIGVLEKLEKLEDGGGRTGGYVDSTRASPRAGVSTRSVSQSDPHRYGKGQASRRSQERGEPVGRTGRGLGQSDVTLPDQSHKTERDLKAIMEGELTCLQAQLRFCAPEVRDETREELVDKTLGWMAEREEKGAKTGTVDKYASKLMETLLTGQTTLGTSTSTGRHRRTSPAGEEAVLAGMGALQIGQHYGAEQDRWFHDDPTRKARCPKIRTGDKPDVYGAKRVLAVKPDLRPHLDGSRYWSGNQR